MYRKKVTSGPCSTQIRLGTNTSTKLLELRKHIRNTAHRTIKTLMNKRWHLELDDKGTNKYNVKEINKVDNIILRLNSDENEQITKLLIENENSLTGLVIYTINEAYAEMVKDGCHD